MAKTAHGSEGEDRQVPESFEFRPTLPIQEEVVRAVERIRRDGPNPSLPRPWSSEPGERGERALRFSHSAEG